MADTFINGDYLSVFTNGWYEIQDIPVAPISSSGVYRNYNNMPNGYITKCSGPAYNNERELYDILLTESYNKHGVCMVYYVTTYDTEYDRIFGEDNNRRFVRKFNFMANFTLPREEKLWTKFGIDGMDQFSMYASKRHFREASSYDYQQTSAGTYAQYIPKMGDIVKSDYANYFYEIVEVKEEIGMAHQSKQHLWEFIVKPFRDERITVPADVSASMPEMAALSNKPADVFNNTSTVDTRKTAIKYVPKPGEKDVGNPFAGW